MRIEPTSVVKNNTTQQQTEGRTPKFINGDIFVTDVVEKSGNSLTLKQADGILFSAKLLSDIGILLGDRVEVIVQETQGGKQVLQMLDIERPTEPQHSDSDTKAELKMHKTGMTSSQNQGARSQVLSNAMTILKQNPAISPKVAMFAAQNNLTITNETVEVLTQMLTEGNAVKMVLEDILSRADALGKHETQGSTGSIGINKKMVSIQQGSKDVSSEEENVPKQNDTKAARIQNNTEYRGTQKKEASTTKQVNPQEEQTRLPTNKEQIKPPTNKEQTEQLQKNLVVKKSKQDVLLKQQSVKNRNTEMQADKGKQTILDTQVADRVRSVFCKLGDEQKTGADIKQDVGKLPSKLRALMSILAETAGEKTEGLASRAAQAEKQLSLMSDTKRFVCFHWPFVLQDDRRNTAELYIYKHKRKKKALDAENIVILLGLDTENIGRVETMIKASGKNISLQFRVSKTEAFAETEHIEKQLRQIVRDAGYYLQGMDVEELVQKTTVLNAEAVLEGEAEIIQGEVDIRI